MNSDDLFDGIGEAVPPPARQWPCPRCRQPMRRIEGKMGPFWGCSTWPKCHMRLYDKDGRPSETPDERFRCPVCTRPMVKAERRNSSEHYWYCTGYNKGCRVQLDDDRGKPAQAWRCPRCGHLLRRRHGRNGLFWGCSQYPLCQASYADDGGRPRLTGLGSQH